MSNSKCMSLILLLSMSTMRPSWDYVPVVKTIIPWVGWVGFIGALSWIGWDQIKNNRILYKSAGIVIESKEVHINESYTYNTGNPGHLATHHFYPNNLRRGESFTYECKINGKSLSFTVENNDGEIIDNIDAFLSAKLAAGAQQQKQGVPPLLPPRDN